MNPPHLWRQTDGRRFSLNQGGRYSMDDSDMACPHSWTLDHLMSTGDFRDRPPATPRLDRFLEAHNQSPELKRLIEFAKQLELDLIETNKQLYMLK